MLSVDPSAVRWVVPYIRVQGLWQPEKACLYGQVGTFSWAAPEVLLGRPCTEKVDIYSFGVMLWELSAGEAPPGRHLRPLRSPLVILHISLDHRITRFVISLQPKMLALLAKPPKLCLAI